MSSDPETKKETKRKTRLSRRIKKFLTRPLMFLACFIIPRLYYCYMTFVWCTSKVEYYGFNKFNQDRIRYKKMLSSLWHESVFYVSYSFQDLSGSTLASVGDFGEIITYMLKLCNFEVFRGGSSKGKSRKREILREMILHMQEYDYVVYGMTVDGSSGPRYHTKKGILLLAEKTSSPLYSICILSKPEIRLPNWDRTLLALPFSRIIHFAEGPYFFPPAETEEEIENLQHQLNEINMDTLNRAQHYLKTGEFLPPRFPPQGNQASTLRRFFGSLSKERVRPILKNKSEKTLENVPEEETL
jgi:lysophospholipid acyltransferase (LPLAT)-like uncharacterized protein